MGVSYCIQIFSLSLLKHEIFKMLMMASDALIPERKLRSPKVLLSPPLPAPFPFSLPPCPFLRPNTGCSASVSYRLWHECAP